MTLPSSSTLTIDVPYIGCMLVLISIGVILTIVYLWLSFRQEASLPIYVKRFGVTLSILLTLLHTALGVILPIRANDYRRHQNAISGKFSLTQGELIVEL